MVLFELILRLKGFPLKEAGNSLTYFNRLQAGARNRWIEEKKQAIVEYHAEHNPLYKKLLGGKPADHWSDLPVIKKADLQNSIASMLSDSYSVNDVYVSNTSGSSGHPFFFAKDKMAHALTWAFVFDRYQKLGIQPGDLQGRFYGIPLDRLSYAKELIKDFVMHRIRFPVFDMGDAMMEHFLERFRNRKIKYVYGYTNAIVLFSKFLLRKGLCLSHDCPSLTCCIVTSEVCEEEDRQVIQKALGVPVIREYGASELDIIAIEDREGRWLVNESNLFIEVLSEDNRIVPVGEEGRLVITSLHNKAMPFIRYDIGDIGSLESGQNGMMIRKLSGRMNDTILLPSGKKSPGLTFYYVSRSILENSGILKEFIIRQTELDQFEFDVVSDRPLNENEIQDIRSKMSVYLEPGLKLKINRMEKIKRPASGKIKHFYSEISK